MMVLFLISGVTIVKYLSSIMTPISFNTFG